MSGGESAGDSSQIVLQDPQYGIVKILRPQAGFEAIYQGAAAATFPILFYPDGQPLDEQAGQNGYDPALIRGLKTTPGQVLQIWLPNVSYIETDDPSLIIRGYEWVVGWRFRTLRDFKRVRLPYHFPRSRGHNDTTVVPAEPRVVIPAAWETLMYNTNAVSPAAAPDAGRTINSIRAMDFTAAAINIRGPLLDTLGTEGVYQQGVADPAVSADSVLPGFLRLELKAAADEMFIGLRRQTGPATYSFVNGAFPGNSDFPLSRLVGNGSGEVFPDIGVYVIRGTDSGLRGMGRTDRD